MVFHNLTHKSVVQYSLDMDEYEGIEHPDDDNDGSGDGSNESDDEEHMVIDPTSVRERIDKTLETLANWRSRKDLSASRSDLISSLAK